MKTSTTTIQEDEACKAGKSEYCNGHRSLVLIMMIIGQSVVLTSAKHVVAFRTGGWTFGVACNWPGNGKCFKYSPQHHNVVRVYKSWLPELHGSRRCSSYSSGNDNIKLVKGQNYFICTILTIALLELD
ncbi:hypothetical protein G4B88_020405 [Cannabis sativa]|uniref:Phytocyanin domain-containing protein n=1 Tax=Cannabis sativa TaxID=3483 RepID=A0A7J6DQH7_CANSA|nr:hypothetical protein G4B88_020405 [Cannabis sativa]